jgi:hypothetical protein
MALKLDIKNDTLIPSQAFQEWADEVLTERGMETSVQIPVIGALFRRNKNLQGKLQELKEKIDRCPAGSDVWFSKMFLWPFGGKVTDDAKSYFDELGKKDSLDELETAARQAAAARQTNGTNLDAACVAALNLLENATDGLPAAVGALGKALSTPTAAPAGAAPAGAAPVRGTKEALIAAFTTDQASAKLIFPKAQNPADQKITTIKKTLNASIIGVSPGGNSKRVIDPLRKAAAEKLLTAAGIKPENLAALTESYSLDDSTLAPVAESHMFSSLDILLESGRITQEDYNRTSKRLLRTSSIINEQAPSTPAAPAASPTPAEKTAAIAANKVKFDGFVSSVAANCTTLATELKGLQTLGKNLAKQTVLGESVHRKIIKSHIKKRILQETAGKDSREQLNEFFLIAALLAALTGAIAWAAAKIGDFFKGSEYGRGTPTYAPRATPEQATKAVEALGSSITAGYGPDGMLVDAAGRRVVGEIQSKQAVVAQLDFSVQNLTAALTLFETIEGEAAAAAEAAGTAENQTPGSALAAHLGVDDAVKKIAATQALTLLAKYRKAGTIRTAVDKVKAALNAV